MDTNASTKSLGTNATGSGDAASTRASEARRALREMRSGIFAMAWAFFDWLAVVSWKKLLLVALLALILGGVLKHPLPVLLLIITSLIVKVVAGGKRRAELTADEATKRAETEQLERRVLEARMQALQAQIEPHFLFNTLASIDQLIQTDPPRASQMQRRYRRSAMACVRRLVNRPIYQAPISRSCRFAWRDGCSRRCAFQTGLNQPYSLR